MMLIILEATQIQGHLERGLFLLDDQFPSTWGWNLNKERITVIREQSDSSQVDIRQLIECELQSWGEPGSNPDFAAGDLVGSLGLSFLSSRKYIIISSSKGCLQIKRNATLEFSWKATTWWF